MKSLLRVGFLLPLVLAVSCEEYKPAPSVQIEGLNGTAFDKVDDLNLKFVDGINPGGVQVDPDTLHLKVVRAAEVAEDTSGGQDLDAIYEWQSDSTGGSVPADGNFDQDDGSLFHIHWKDTNKPPPGATPLQVLLLPGIQDYDKKLSASKAPQYSAQFNYPLGACHAGDKIENKPKLNGRYTVGFHAALSKPSTYNFGMLVDMWIDNTADTAPNVLVNLFGTNVNTEDPEGYGDKHCTSGQCSGSTSCVAGDCKTNGANMQRPEWFPDYVWTQPKQYGGRVVNMGCVQQDPENPEGIQIVLFESIYASAEHPNIQVTHVFFSGRMAPRKGTDPADRVLDGVGNQDIKGTVTLEHGLLKDPDGKTAGGGVLTFWGIGPKEPALKTQNGEKFPVVTKDEKDEMAKCRDDANTTGAICDPCKNAKLNKYQTPAVCSVTNEK